MRIRSASNPTTAKVAVGSDTLYVSEFNLLDSTHDRNLTYPVVGMAESVSGFTPSAVSDGLKLTKLTSSGSYVLTHNTTFSQSRWAFESTFSARLNTSSLTDDFVIQRMRFSDGIRQYAAEIAYSFTSQRIEVRDIADDGTGAVFSVLGNMSLEEGIFQQFTMQVIKNGSTVNLYVAKDSKWQLMRAVSIPFSGAVTLTLEADDATSVSSGEVIWTKLLNMPVMDGANGFSTELQFYQLPICTARNADECAFNVWIDHPKTALFDIDVYGTGTNISTMESIQTYTDTRNVVEDQWGFVKSEVETLYLEGSYIYTCPEVVPPDEGSVGDILINVNCCFPDGEAISENRFQVVGQSFGRVELNTDLSHSPKFTYTDDNDLNYGCAFEFQQIMHNGVQDTTLQTIDPDFRISMLKSIALGESSRIYYGTVVDPMGATTRDHFFTVTYQWSDVQLLDMLTPYDAFFWKICKEDGTVVQTSGVDIDVLNYTSNVPVASSLEQGRYYLEVSAYKLDNGSAIGTVHEGTSALGAVVNTCYAAPKVLNTQADYQQNEWGISRAYFEVREHDASLFVVVQDPENDTDFYLKYESACSIDATNPSLACFIDMDGNPVFVYKKIETELTTYESRTNKIYYKKLYLTTGLFSTEGFIRLPLSLDNGSYVHSFDIGKTDEYTIDLFISVGNEEIVKESNGVQRSISKTPFGVFGKMVLNVSIIDFDGSDIIIEDVDFVDLPITSVNDLWQYPRPDMFYGEEKETWERLFFADSIRVVRNESYDVDVVSVLDLGTRTPVVLMGKGTSYKEIAVPMHFESKQKIEDETGSTAYYKHVSLGIDSLSATIGHDGMVYSAATQGGICEIGVIDPSLYWNSRTGVIHPQLIRTGSNRQPLDIYRPDFRFENLQTISLDISLDRVGKAIVDISSFQHYMSISVGDNIYLNYPMVFQNGILSMLGYEASMERVVVGSHGNALPTWIDEQAALYGSTATADVITLQAIGNSTYSSTYFNMLMSDATCYHHQHLKLDEGYRFHTRVTPEYNIDAPFDRPFIFTAKGMGYYDPADLDGFLTSAEARLVYYGDTVDFEIYLYKTASWETIYTAYLDPYATYDFDIVMKRTGLNIAKIGFTVREPRYEQSYRFTETAVDFWFENYWIIKTNDTVEDYDWGWSGGSDSNPTDLNDFIHVHNMGYGLLKQSNGMFNITEDTKGGSPYFAYTEGHFDSEIGRWRQFNDIAVFGYEFNKPMYPFIAGFFNSSSQSNRFHFPKGYLLKLNRGTITGLDRWTISRSLLYDPKFTASKYAPGYWVNNADQQEVIIWANAEDSGLERLDVDTVLIQGANFCQSTLVGRQTEFDSWEDIQTFYADVYHISDITVIEGNGYATAKSATCDFAFGLDQSQTWYYKERTSGQVCQIIDVQAGQLLLDISNGQTLTESEATIFSSVQIFELTKVSYPLIGLRIDSSNQTAQGYYQLDTVDFGTSRLIPLADNHDVGGGAAITLRGSANQLLDKNTPLFNPDATDRKAQIEYTFNWTSVSKGAYAKMLSLVNNVHYNARPVWVLNSSMHERRVGRLCYFSAPFTHQIVLDEDGRITYNMSTSLKGIE